MTGTREADSDRRQAYQEDLRLALLRQEEAIGGFIRAAAMHLADCAQSAGGAAEAPGTEAVRRAAASDTGEAARLAAADTGGAARPAAAEPYAAALADAARMAEALAELQRLTLQLARTLGAGAAQGKQSPGGDGAACPSVRISPPARAAPAWFAAAPGKPGGAGRSSKAASVRDEEFDS
ncbi:hypothetical protein [Cohnella sp. JJ-181]|uniref:hypothetical protein n=1 Tax=Cohnella rhizoplanae TaxID=2974897 RepID=UPI0022FF6F90|nr:hypothetical protein [Cohnella sp. JJ-181]CAI6069979.1 hypothetical protein COHCIP112018_02241 [Cohnella sp. JJ-181]